MWLSLHRSTVTGKYETSGYLFLATEKRELVEKGLLFWKDSLPYSQEQVGRSYFMLRMAQKDTVKIVVFKVFKVINVFTATSVGQMKICNYSKLFVLISNSTHAVLIKPLLKS